MALILALFTRTFLVQGFKVPSESMAPGLLPGDHILINKFIYGRGSAESRLLPQHPPRRFEVVVFRSPQTRELLIKRCVGLGGDTIAVRAGQLSIAGIAVDESAYTQFSRPPGRPEDPAGPEVGPLRVPPGSCFCLGDQRDRSQDSRHWGAVPKQLIFGRALLIYWSVAADRAAEGRGNTYHSDGFWARIGHLLGSAFHFCAHARWGRICRLIR